MNEFDEHLLFYSNYWFKHFSKDISEEEWGDTVLAESYLRKYWLSTLEYKKIWQPIFDKIFINTDKGLPNLKFNDNYRILTFNGGCLFVKNDFKQLQDCILAIGDEYLVVYENTFGGKLSEPAFRMKFPSTISWDELNSGNYISSIILETNHKEFYVFSESGLWGKYAASDYDIPLDIIGFRSELEFIFKQNFKQTNHERNE